LVIGHLLRYIELLWSFENNTLVANYIIQAYPKMSFSYDKELTGVASNILQNSSKQILVQIKKTSTKIEQELRSFVQVANKYRAKFCAKSRLV